MGLNLGRHYRGSESKESTCSVGDLGLIPGFGSFPWGGHGSPLQSSCLENPMDRGAWWAAVPGVRKSEMTEWLTLSYRIDCRLRGLTQLPCIISPRKAKLEWVEETADLSVSSALPPPLELDAPCRCSCWSLTWRGLTPHPVMFRKVSQLCPQKLADGVELGVKGPRRLSLRGRV